MDTATPALSQEDAADDGRAGAGSAVGRSAKLVLELAKARITFAVTFSVTTGWVVHNGSFDLAMLVPVLGVFLLACGSAALNQVQEWRTDARMARTKDRPIPSGRITSRGALVVSVLFMAAGLNVLSYTEQNVGIVLGLGAFSVVFYNGIYWALKRMTAFAVVPGALIGAIPPLMGWAAAGGRLLDRSILEICTFFFIWQIPHFWLLVHIYGKQYEDAGLPAATSVITPKQLQRITVVWTFLTVVCGLVLMRSQIATVPWNALALAASALLVWAGLGYRKLEPTAKDARRFFMQLNAYALAMMLLLMGAALTR